MRPRDLPRGAVRLREGRRPHDLMASSCVSSERHHSPTIAVAGNHRAQPPGLIPANPTA
jgi:hypothetical protein